MIFWCDARAQCVPFLEFRHFFRIIEKSLIMLATTASFLKEICGSKKSSGLDLGGKTGFCDIVFHQFFGRRILRFL